MPFDEKLVMLLGSVSSRPRVADLEAALAKADLEPPAHFYGQVMLNAKQAHEDLVSHFSLTGPVAVNLGTALGVAAVRAKLKGVHRANATKGDLDLRRSLGYVADASDALRQLLADGMSKTLSLFTRRLFGESLEVPSSQGDDDDVSCVDETLSAGSHSGIGDVRVLPDAHGAIFALGRPRSSYCSPMFNAGNIVKTSLLTPSPDGDDVEMSVDTTTPLLLLQLSSKWRCSRGQTLNSLQHWQLYRKALPMAEFYQPLRSMRLLLLHLPHRH